MEVVSQSDRHGRINKRQSEECEHEFGIESESESERYLFDPHKKLIQSNNEKQLGSGDPY